MGNKEIEKELKELPDCSCNCCTLCEHRAYLESELNSPKNKNGN